MEEFIKELYLLLKKHKVDLDNCGCCGGTGAYNKDTDDAFDLGKSFGASLEIEELNQMLLDYENRTK